MWSSRPMVRITIFFIAGIITGQYFSGSIDAVVWLSISLISVIISVPQSTKSYSRKIQRVKSFFLFISIYALGSTTLIVNNPTTEIPDYSSTCSFLGKIIESPVEKEKYIKVIASVYPVTDTLQSTKSILYLEKRDSSHLIYGDNILIDAKLTPVRGPGNPYEFNYREYLLSKGITHTAFVKSDNWQITGNKPHSKIMAIGISLRNRILMLLREKGLKGESLSVASAVLLGYDDYMEQETKLEFMKSGSMHILCVSGLHVGILYLVLNLLLGFFPRTNAMALLKSIILLSVIWLYATITGFSPSVQRAALMISTFIIGNMINRKSDSYNTLAVSALILLIINPNLIFSVGFQLSYTAVLGIISFYYPIYNFIRVKNLIIDKIWSVTILSISAQLGTFPLAIYYFNYFPGWFLVSNLITFPLSFLILTSGLIFIVIGWIPYVSTLVGHILSILVNSLNLGVGLVNMLPSNYESNLYMSLPMLCVVYLLVFLSYRIIKQPHPRLLKYIFGCLITVSVLSLFHKYSIINQHRYMIYCVNNHVVHEVIIGNQQILFSDSAIIRNPSKLGFHIGGSRAKWGLGKEIEDLQKDSTKPISGHKKVKDFTIVDSKVFLTVNENSTYIKTKSKFKVDCIIISGININLNQILSAYCTDLIIIENIVSPWEAHRVMRFADSLGIDHHQVRKEGAINIIEL